jgi:pimeloyl-ACP methyl ester carboxylesterase
VSTVDDTGGGAMAIAVAPEYEGSRAMAADEDGYIERDGVRVFWERYGDGEPTVLFMPTWSLVHSRVWRAQIPYFARHFRVVVFDGRGNGKSDRPLDPAAYHPRDFVADALAVMEASSTERAILVSLSLGTVWNLMLGAVAPERVQAAAFVGPSTYAVCDPFPSWSQVPFNERFDSYDGFEGQNRWFIQDYYTEFVDYWVRLGTPEPHSSRAIEYAVGMALETTPEVVMATLDARFVDSYHCTADRLREAGKILQPLARQIRHPVLVINGELDAIAPTHWARALAQDSRGELVVIEGAGHHPGGRKPVRFNLELRRFVEQVAADRR